MPVMTGGLAAYLSTGAESAAAIIAGSLLVVTGMVLFVVVLIRDLRGTLRLGRSLTAPAALEAA
jgi:hypothetical protein